MIENFNDMKNKLVLLGYEVKEFDCNRLNLFSPSGEKVVTIYDSINKDIIIKLPDDADNKVSESGEKKCSTSISMYIQQATGLIDFTIHNVTVIGGNISYIKKLLD